MKGRTLYQCACTRRDALKAGAATVGLMTCGGTLTGCGEATLDEPFSVPRSEHPELDEVGGVARISTNDSGFAFPIYVVRFGDEEYAAYSSECTHFGCEVELQSFATGFVCPCHGSEFDIDGAVRNGPAKQDLVTFVVTIDEETVTVSPG